MLDTRQFRSDQPNGDKASELNAEALDPKQTMLGSATSRLAPGLLLASHGHLECAGPASDDGPGRSASRWRGIPLLDGPVARLRRGADPAGQVPRRTPRAEPGGPDRGHPFQLGQRPPRRRPRVRHPVVATEFVGTSISSGGNGSSNPKTLEALRSENPGVRHFDAQRGYVRLHRDARLLADRSRPGRRRHPSRRHRPWNARPSSSKRVSRALEPARPQSLLLPVFQGLEIEGGARTHPTRQRTHVPDHHGSQGLTTPIRGHFQSRMPSPCNRLHNCFRRLNLHLTVTLASIVKLPLG